MHGESGQVELGIEGLKVERKYKWGLKSMGKTGKWD